MVSTSYVRCAYMYFRFYTHSIFYHYEVKYARSSPFWPCFFTLSFNAFISLLVRNSNISAPFLLFVTSPYCPMFSFGLLAFPIFQLKSPTKTSSPCLIHFIHLLLSLRTSSVYLLPYSSTLGACRCFLRKDFSPPSPLVPLSICFRNFLCLRSPLVCHTKIR